MQKSRLAVAALSAVLSALSAVGASVSTAFGPAEYVKHVPEAKTQVAAVLYALTDDFKNAKRCPVAKLNARGYAVIALDCTGFRKGNVAAARAAAIKAVKAAMRNDPDIAADRIGVILDKVQVGWDEDEANWMALADDYDRKGWNADPAKVAKTRTFKAMSWNLEGGSEGEKEIASFVALVKDVNPDVVLICEQYGKLPAFLAGLGGGWNAERYSMNLGLLTRWPIVKTDRPYEAPWNYLDPTGPFNFGFAELNVGGQRIRTCPLWMNWDSRPSFSNPRTEEMKGILGSIRGAIAEADEVPILLGGDYNGYVEPHEPMMAKAGFTDTYRLFHPELDGTNAFTWASHDGRQRAFIDYIFSKGKKLKPVASEIFHAPWHRPFAYGGKEYASFPSDHGFVLTTFEFELPPPLSQVFLTKGASKVEKGIPYRDDVEGCVLDLCHPVGVTNFPTVVWFHGGGLTAGRRDWIGLDTNRVAVATVEYRLMPTVGPDGCLDDGAAAAAWVKRHIAEYGGDPKRVFVSGHSAGGYMTFMLGLDKRWLAKYGLSPFDFAGYMPLSGQATKHFAVRRHFGHKENAFQPIVDEWAPMYHLAKRTPPFCVVLGDRRIEWRMRVEENEFMCESLKAMGNESFEFHSIPETNHGSCRGPAMPIFQRFIDAH